MLDIDSAKFSAPIPGMSLTTEPKARIWEKPAKYADPEDALKFYINQLNSPDMLNRMADILESQFPATALTDGLILGGVMEGLHSVDVGIIISPALYIFIKEMGRMMEVEVVTGLEETDVPDEGMLRMAMEQEVVEEDSQEQEELAQVIDEAIQDMNGGIMSKPLDEGEM
tara:strand:+ start:1012 stop:1521 length:510 start_codon:yes stop_codon:yes gene_type:complete